jgi:hypothetical protein
MTLALDKHFSPIELAKLWGLSPQKIRQLFEGEPGVLRIGEPCRRVGRTLKRAYHTIRIPETVAIRVHQKLIGPTHR